MIRESRPSSTRWIGRRITGSCGGNGEPPEKGITGIRGAAWPGPKGGRDYGYVVRREKEEK